MSRCSLVLLLSLLAAPALAAGGDACRTHCTTQRCVRRAARCLLEVGRPSEAKRLLKQQLSARHAGSLPLQLLLSRSYADLGNTAWSRRVLYQAATRHPRDCQVRAWLIWQHLTAAELDEATRLLGEAGCPTLAPSVRGRYALLAATLARYRQQPDRATTSLARALAKTTLFSEDHALLASLVGYALPGRPTPLQLRADLAVGYSTNAMMSTPVDLGALGGGSNTGSPLASLDLSGRLEPPWPWPLRPLLEVDLRSMLLLRKAPGDPRGSVVPFDYSYLSLAARPGVVIGKHGPRLFYSGQLFLLAGDDEYQAGPRWFYETHRGELEWEPASWLSIWGGAGRSLFREQGRSRSEVDLGAGILTRPWRDLRLLIGLSGRRHWARHQRYDLWGGTLIGSLTKPLGRLTARGRLVASLDLYPRSAGLFADSATAPQRANRRDLLLKGAAELWSPSVGPLRFALGYEIAGRASNANSYDFVDQRLLLRMRVSLTGDPWLPGEDRGDSGHVTLPWGLSREERLADDRIQELLRQEDAARRGSACLN